MKGDFISGSSELKSETLVFFIGALFVFGLGAIIGLMVAMKFVFGSENLGLIVFFTLLSFLVMLAVEGVFVWMLLGRKRGVKEAVDTRPFDEQAGREAGEARALPEPALSVTDHTTRTLEPAATRQKTE
jgi:hypothetical protein